MYLRSILAKPVQCVWCQQVLPAYKSAPEYHKCSGWELYLDYCSRLKDQAAFKRKAPRGTWS